MSLAFICLKNIHGSVNKGLTSKLVSLFLSLIMTDSTIQVLISAIAHVVRIVGVPVTPFVKRLEQILNVLTGGLISAQM